MPSAVTAQPNPEAEFKISLPALRDMGRGHHVNIATALGDHFGRVIDQTALEEALAPLSDGGVLALGHAVGARTALSLMSRASGSDLASGSADRMRSVLSHEPALAEEIITRRAALIERGRNVGVEFFDRDMSIPEIEEMIRSRRVGLVSLDWSIIIGDSRFKHALDEAKDNAIILPGRSGSPFLFPVVPVVGMRPDEVLLHTYSMPFLPVPKELFDEARRSARAEKAFIFVTMGDVVTRFGAFAKEEPKPLDADAIRKEYRVAERRAEKQESWDYFTEAYGNNEDLVDGLLRRAGEYGLSHQAVKDFFEFVYGECKALTPVPFSYLSKAIDVVRLGDIGVAEFGVFLEESLKAVRKIRLDSEATTKPMNNFDTLGKFEDLCLHTAERIAAYNGPGRPNLSTVLRYRMMDQKLLEGPPGVEVGSSRTEVAPRVTNPPFSAPDLAHPEKTCFTVVHPPHPGEPLDVTRTRIILQWLEDHGGNSLRDCLVQALGTGSVRIAGGEEHDVYTSPLHRISGALRDKIGNRTPYFIDELCLNHGLTAWEMLADFDAAVEAAGGALPEMADGLSGKVDSFRSLWTWNFGVRGLMQNIHEAIGKPTSFTAEMKYLSDILPWMLAGKVHTSYATSIAERFASKDHRIDDSEGQKLLGLMGTAERYLKQLLKAESQLSHDTIWRAWSAIESKEQRMKIEPLLVEALTANDSISFGKSWKAMLVTMKHGLELPPDMRNFQQVFLQFGLHRKAELKKREEAA